MQSSDLDLRPPLVEALEQRLPVVALESTLISHGLPWPQNLETAIAAENAVRDSGAIPATIGIVKGRPIVGLTAQELEGFARGSNIRKASSRDLGVVIAQQLDAATTVSATMRLAHRAGIRVFATGGIGGVHPASQGQAFDVSADLIELGRTPVAVVCAGAKSILDLEATLEVLETQGVPVLGYQTDRFPAFYVRSSSLSVSARLDYSNEIAHCLTAHWTCGGAGVVVAQPVAGEFAIAEEEMNDWLARAEEFARQENIRGAALTPFLLSKIAQFSCGRTVQVNQALIVANARLAAQISVELARSKP